MKTTRKRNTFNKHLHKYWMLYAMSIPGIIWLILFRYIPISGSVIMFQDYSIFRGIFKSPFVGLKHFQYLFAYPDFLRILGNTLILGFHLIFLIFPVPIVLALCINEVRQPLIKKGIQSMFYLPHFLSWVIIASLAFRFLSLDGPVNQFAVLLGGEPTLFMQKEVFFRGIVTLASLYKETGWETIIYLAAITGINPELYEAAMADGANKFQRVLHITLPGILPTAVIVLLLRIGDFMNLGFDRIYNFLTPMTYSVGDIFDTYVYRIGIMGGQYSLTTAIGFFQSIVGLVLVVSFNKLTKRISGGLW